MLQRGSNGKYEVINLIGLSLFISCFHQEHSGNECNKQCKTSLCQWYSNGIYLYMHTFSQGIHRKGLWKEQTFVELEMYNSNHCTICM